MIGVERIDCPNCKSGGFTPWAEEFGFTVVRCNECALLYVNPRPRSDLISEAVKTGVHSEETGGLVVTARRVGTQVRHYRRVLEAMFADLHERSAPVAWLDVGAGYGEFVEAVAVILPPGSTVEGLEPMKPKADDAKSRGLNIVNDYLRSDHAKVDVVSTINVFSHMPEFDDFLATARCVLTPRGEVFIETGNLADLKSRNDFPGELGLPDHLVFCGEPQMKQFLDRAGFDVVDIRRLRTDGLAFSLKCIVKNLIGRRTHVRLPYTSTYRSLLIRARLR